MVQRCDGLDGGDAHILGGDLAKNGFLRAIGFGAEGCAFQHLAEIIGQRLGKAMMNGRGREHGTVAAAAADDHLRALLQQRQVRMHPGHGDDAVRGGEFGFRIAEDDHPSR